MSRAMNCRENNPIIVVIPCLEPEDSLLFYVHALKENGLTEIILVDDGSGAAYQPIFHELSTKGCTVLYHEQNLGKGCALKTAFQYIQTHYSYFCSIITVDSDGQHAVADVVRIAALSKQEPNALVLGVRDFAVEGVPAKSLLGNRFTSFVFAALYGRRLSDTQTGLRAFGMTLLPTMLATKGARFEYEIQMLITCAQMGIPFCTMPIQVIYQNNNAGTHFKPLQDSARIIGTLIWSFLRFSASSLAGAAVDIWAAWLLLDFLRPFFASEYLRILTATVLARAVSILLNYLLNRNFVFREKRKGGRSLARYLMLCVLIILLSASGVFALYTLFGLNEKAGKVICDMLLFLVSYRVQMRWVFAKD